jgi:hypothetical protein
VALRNRLAAVSCLCTFTCCFALRAHHRAFLHSFCPQLSSCLQVAAWAIPDHILRAPIGLASTVAPVGGAPRAAGGGAAASTTSLAQAPAPAPAGIGASAGSPSGAARGSPAVSVTAPPPVSPAAVDAGLADMYKEYLLAAGFDV